MASVVLDAFAVLGMGFAMWMVVGFLLMVFGRHSRSTGRDR